MNTDAQHHSNSPTLHGELQLHSWATNEYVLTERERQQARLVLRDIDETLSSLDQRIEQLLIERESVARRRARVHIALAPHKRLPTEIIGQIFACAVDGDPVEFPIKQSQLFWVLRQVCSRWRQVALNDPRIWNAISIDGFRLKGRELLNIASFITTVIPRTGLLSLAFRHRDGEDFLTVVKKIVHPVLHRVKELKVNIPASALPDLFALPHDSLYNLQSLYLHVTNPERPLDAGFARRPTTSIFFRGAANLRALELHAWESDRLQGVLLALPIQWNQLTSLVMTELRPLQVVNVQSVLTRCFSLEKLHVKFAYRASNPTGLAGDDAHLRLPYLRQVELEGMILHPHSLTDIGLPWKQLTVLRVEELSGTNRHRIHVPLDECVNVERLVLVENKSIALPSGPLQLPRLKHLATDQIAMMAGLVAPALMTLSITSGTLEFPAKILSDIVQHSHCLLSEFTYCGIKARPEGADDSEIANFLSHQHAMKAFHVNDLVLDPFDLQPIIKGELLPQLSSLTCGMPTEALEEFVNVLDVHARTWHAGKAKRSMLLKNITLHVEDVGLDCAEAARIRLQKLNEEFGTSWGLCENDW
ncbi:hypothetical protein LshimejAT787_1800130 [Lyophyllum shimeji]|uniref:F-box domain-containing protein n=1 Tax=Lyophyllum shimeji TaxID=47721 RepID=A0A9P3PZV8_LYOSH|nr:hypothetical protein LshimejAT787_1800130 [Lyophyllum shimeji]